MSCSCNKCDSTNESLSSQLNNFIDSFYGPLTKSCVNNQVVWSLPCNLEDGIAEFPRQSGEGLACYFLRFMQQTGISPAPSGLSPSVRTCFEPDISIADNTETIVGWNTFSWDTGGMHDPNVLNTRLTATTSGKYIVQGQIGWAASSGGMKELIIRQNGTRVRGRVKERIDDGSDTSESSYMQIQSLAEFAPGEYVELSVYQNSGSPVNIEAYNEHSWFGMTRVST